MIDLLAKIFPDVRRPRRRLSFKTRLKWTFIVLLLYFFLGSIPLYGLSPRAVDYFQNVRAIIAGHFGSIITLGIGPIVTAGIILQLLIGAELLKLDLHTPEGRKKYEELEKAAVILVTLFEASVYVLLGGLPPAQNTLLAKLLLILQLVLGTFLIVLLDQLSSRWGLISGISLFIAASVSTTIVTGALNPLPNPENPEVPAGKLWATFRYFIDGDPASAFASFLPILFTLLVFAVAVYASNIRVEVPIAAERVRGYITRWPLNFFYTSNIPVIFTAALLANLEMWFRFLGARGLTFFAQLDATGRPTGGLIMYLIPPRELLYVILSSPIGFLKGVFAGGIYTQLVLRALVYTLIMILGSLMFARFWVYTANMDSESVARQLIRSGLTIPGFRKDPRVLKRILDRYIPQLTDLGAIAVGALAAFADFTHCLARGTGILLTVMIFQRFFQTLMAYYAMEMAPQLKKFLGVERL